MLCLLGACLTGEIIRLGEIQVLNPTKGYDKNLIFYFQLQTPLEVGEVLRFQWPDEYKWKSNGDDTVYHGEYTGPLQDSTGVVLP